METGNKEEKTDYVNAGIAKRIGLVMTHYDINQADLGQVVGISAGAVSQMINGTTKKIDVAIIVHIKKNWHEVNLNWLLFGKGKMLHERDDGGNIIEDPETPYGMNNDLLTQKNKLLKQELDRVWSLIDKFEFRAYPTGEKPRRNRP